MSSVFLYVDRESPLHRMHPVTKVVGLVLGFAVSLVFSHPLPALGALVLALIVLAAAGGLTNLARAWKFLLILFVMTTLIWAFFLQVSGPMGKGGEPAFSLGLAVGAGDVSAVRQAEGRVFVVGHSALVLYCCRGSMTFEMGSRSIGLVEVSRQTVAYGVAMALRIVACLVFGLAFLSCTRTEDFALALRTLGAPQGVSIAVSLAFRLVPTLAGTARNVIEAQQARGVDPAAGNVFRRMRNYVPLVTPVLAYALRGADLTAMALESRGLGGDPTRRTHYREFRVGMGDVLLIAALIVLTAACIVARLQGYGVVTFGG